MIWTTALATWIVLWLLNLILDYILTLRCVKLGGGPLWYPSQTGTKTWWFIHILQFASGPLSTINVISYHFNPEKATVSYAKIMEILSIPKLTEPRK